MKFSFTALFPLIITQLAFTPAFTQKIKPPQKNPGSRATVLVSVADGKQHPRRGETVLFISEKSHQVLSANTNSQGKCSLSLSAGEVYAIKLTTLSDTVHYSQLEIPALESGQYFDSPFTVDITYEPARTFTLDNVHFDTGKPTLRPASFKELDEIAAYMKLKPEEKFEIGGHTDNVGKAEDNLRLSQQRAESVKRYLVKKGVQPQRITAKGYGATQPLADNASEEGRQQNRRTEVTIL
jgi:outer membrane protein OmpA-like peptidoglycan-associated protein